MPPETPHILVVDDEPDICQSCVKILSKIGYRVTYALNGESALQKLSQADFDVIITDLKMNRMGGMELLQKVKEIDPEAVVIVITGYSTVSSAVEVIKLGAFDYLPKPFTPPELRATVKQALEKKASLRQNRRLIEDTPDSKPLAHRLIGTSPKIKKVISMISKVAPTDATVLICGDSGTGKELVARAVHANSRRAGQVFFAVDCATLTDNLLESELFGHTKGAFTGAHRDKPGVFEMAHNGTVFLDEIGNTSLEVQGKLLRFLEMREFLPLGAITPRKVDVRLIFATNRRLDEMVKAGTVRQDFYYRIWVYPIFLPPLKERKADILPIAYHFLRQFSQKLHKQIDGFNENAVSRLIAFDWPGNVRQLRNVVEHAVILCESRQIGARDLSLLNDTEDITALFDAVPLTNQELKAVKKELRQKAVASVERNFIYHALLRNGWNVTRAAEETGLQRTNFQTLMKKHGIVAAQSKKVD